MKTLCRSLALFSLFALTSPAHAGGAPSLSPPLNLSAIGLDQRIKVNFSEGRGSNCAVGNYQFSTNDGTNFVALNPASSATNLFFTTQSGSGTPALVNGTTYTVRLKAVGAGPCSSTTSTASGSVTVTPTAIADCSSGQTFTTPDVASGGMSSCKVPANVLKIAATACGAKGNNSSNGNAGGLGASVSREITVTAGDILGFAVGGGTTTHYYGVNGGGRSGNTAVTFAPGGGWSGVFLNPTIFGTLAEAAASPTAQIIAAGGGGAGTAAGAAGGNAGAAGSGTNAGGAASDSAGGTAGSGGGGAGAAGQGGFSGGLGGGGGGGGRFGGGGGSGSTTNNTSGGGGGSSFDGAHVASPTVMDCGNSGHGKVTLSNFVAATVNGACDGTANNVATSGAPTALCATGTGSTVTSSNGAWGWTCTGTGTGATNATCSAPYQSQTLSFGTAPTLVVDGTAGTVSAQSTSGLKPVLSSTTTTACTLGTTTNTATGVEASVTGKAAGTCTVLADLAQSADGCTTCFLAAMQATQNISIRHNEASVPSSGGNSTGDGNGDTIPDNTQPSVESLPTFTGGSFVTVVSTSGRTLSVTAIALPLDLPANLDAPLSAVAFTLTSAAATESIELYFPATAGITGLMKKNRLTGNYDSLNTTITTVGNKTRLVFTLDDNGPYDTDLTPGVISDPVIPIIGGGGRGHDDGFLGLGALNPLMLVLLGLFGVRRRRFER